jgi:hypothetical protein
VRRSYLPDSVQGRRNKEYCKSWQTASAAKKSDKPLRFIRNPLTWILTSPHSTGIDVQQNAVVGLPAFGMTACGMVKSAVEVEDANGLFSSCLSRVKAGFL